jgi:hypothetical protein
MMVNGNGEKKQLMAFDRICVSEIETSADNYPPANLCLCWKNERKLGIHAHLHPAWDGMCQALSNAGWGTPDFSTAYLSQTEAGATNPTQPEN